ncbi:MAG: thioesterase family protein [Gemmatimonadetes bacterium]|nr:thioesterase family protein [Gemmatimonadota bacterium]
MPSTSTETRVRYAETDQMGVAYHANYLVWCEMGRTDFIRQHVRSYAELEREGVALAVSDASIRYHAAARYDEVVRITTTLVEVRSRALVFDYLMTRQPDGERLASAQTTLVSLGKDGKLTAMPEDLRARLEVVKG